MLAAWKLIPAVFMLGALVAGFFVRPPREPVSPGELKQLIAAVAALYIVGGVALAMHRTPLAAVVFGSGLVLCALALWLSRGQTPPPRDDNDGGGGGGGQPPLDPLPIGPDALPVGPDFDWGFYEDQFREPVA
jgi:hypothetical protein